MKDLILLLAFSLKELENQTEVLLLLSFCFVLFFRGRTLTQTREKTQNLTDRTY